MSAKDKFIYYTIACILFLGFNTLLTKDKGIKEGYIQGQQSIEKVIYIGDLDKDGHKDIAAVFKNKEDGKTYKIFYETEEGQYVFKGEGFDKNGLPLDYAQLEKIAIDNAKKLDQPTTQEEINKTMIDRIMEEK